jgi:CheY-like chemotaxis protein
LCKPIDSRKLVGLIRHHAKTRRSIGPPFPEDHDHSLQAVPSISDSAPLRVLIVEDDRQVCKLMCMQLEAKGFDVSWAASGSDALKLASQVHPDVVVMDVGLPDMNGLEVTSQIKKVPQMYGAVFIALSGRSEPEYQEAACAAGFDHYLVKPASLESLVALFPRPEMDPN